MKKIKKLLTLSLALPICSVSFFANADEGTDAKTLICKLAPWTCTASTLGAGGSGHGGDNGSGGPDKN